MKPGIFPFAVLVVLYALSPSLNVMRPATALELNSVLIENIESAAGPQDETILVVSDTVSITEDLTIHGLSMTIICEQLVTADKTIQIAPNRKDENEFDKNGNGRHGKQLIIFTRSAVTGNIILPGGKGDTGKWGDDGKWGNKQFEAKEVGNHYGKPGQKGFDGFPGGNGGLLRIYSAAPKADTRVTLNTTGGEGGKGGQGGIGGWTYYQIAKPRHEGGEITPNNAVYELRNYQEKNGDSGRRGANGRPPGYQFFPLNDSMLVKERAKYGITEENKAEFSAVSLLGAAGTRKTFNFSGNE